jgi:hypothetical protein
MTAFLYGLDSMVARLPKLAGSAAEAGELSALLLAREGAFALREKLDLVLNALGASAEAFRLAERMLSLPRFNAVAARNRLAELVLQRGGYPF